jgi:hypothetical protein
MDNSVAPDFAVPQPDLTTMRTRKGWKVVGYRIRTKAIPDAIEPYLVPGYKAVYRDRHLFACAQVAKIDPANTIPQAAAAKKVVATRIHSMIEDMESAELDAGTYLRVHSQDRDSLSQERSLCLLVSALYSTMASERRRFPVSCTTSTPTAWAAIARSCFSWHRARAANPYRRAPTVVAILQVAEEIGAFVVMFRLAIDEREQGFELAPSGRDGVEVRA